jgi:hypothetical protein
MLDAYIIEEIKRRESERLQQERARPRVEIEAPRDLDDEEDSRSSPDDRPARGNRVVQIDLLF